MDNLVEVRTVTIYLIHTPAMIVIGGGEEYPLAIPVQH